MLDLSVVVLNYNGGDLLKRAVEAAIGGASSRLGVVVVDNGSTDGSLEPIETDLAPAARAPLLVLRTGRNLGFAKGNNAGIGALDARYVALLNPDALVLPGTLDALVGFMDSHPRVGICGPRLTWPGGEPQPFSHGGDPTPLYLLRRFVARRSGKPLHDWDGPVPRPVDWVSGTCMLLRSAMLAEVGLLDERIFMYFEDNDICLRAREAGWGVYFVPSVSVRHYNRPSYADKARQASYMRGLALFYRRHYGRTAALLVHFASLIRGILP